MAVLSGLNDGATRPAYRVGDVATIESHAFARDSIEIGSGDSRRIIGTECLFAMIIREYEQDVGPIGGKCWRGEAKHQRGNEKSLVHVGELVWSEEEGLGGQARTRVHLAAKLIIPSKNASIRSNVRHFPVVGRGSTIQENGEVVSRGGGIKV